MHQPSIIALTMALAMGAVATPVSSPEESGLRLVYSKLEPIAPKDENTLRKRVTDGTVCFHTGPYMGNERLIASISQWCRDHDGQSVPLGQVLSAQYSGVPLVGGTPGDFAGSYKNTEIVDGWVVTEEECKYHMTSVVNNCQGGSGNDSQGGYIGVSNAGDVTADPNETHNPDDK